MASGSLPPIILVDDNPDDLFFLRERLRRAKVDHPLLSFGDGEEAMVYLQRYATPDAGPLPCLMFLDLRMPRCGGFEVLKWVRDQPWLDRMPVAIVTTSTLPEDAARAQRLGASHFFNKYPPPDVLAEVVANAGRTVA